jgi:transglutaminase-like putative cysteine protease
MSWRLRIRHETRVNYDGRVRASYNEARMIPLTLPEQTTLEARIETRPAASVWRYWDYWGTQVTAFDLQEPHDSLLITASSTVETLSASAREIVGWETLREPGVQDQLVEFLDATPRTTVQPELAEAATQRVEGADPHATADEIAAWVNDSVDYVPGATGVQTSAQEAWAQGQGVCQDIAHLTVALFRVVGLPARYVSGYLHPDPDPEPGDTIAGQSHAWVEYWAGGWVGCDPTNRVPAGERHVVVARGRDYDDVSPFKGIYHGAPGSTLGITVDVTRVA